MGVLVAVGVAASITSWAAYVRGRPRLGTVAAAPAMVALAWCLLFLAPDVRNGWGDTTVHGTVVTAALTLAIAVVAAQVAARALMGHRWRIAGVAAMVATGTSLAFVLALATVT